MSVFPRNVVTALPAWVLLVLCAGCPGTELECKTGYHVEGGACVPDETPVPPPPPNPCQPNPCTAQHKTVCSVSGGAAVCACDSGYFPVGDGCEQDPPPDCSRRHALGDAFEPDECPSLAHPVSTSGVAESHTLSTQADEDWSRLSVTSGNIYEVQATGEIQELRLRVSLYDQDGTTELASEAGTTTNVRLSYKARATGDLYTRIVSADRTTVGPYQLSFHHLGTDDLADAPAEATPVMTPAQTPGSGALQFDGDVDVVRMKLEGGGRTYRFESSWAAATAGVLKLELLGTDGTTVLASNESSSTPRFIYRMATPGEYFLRLSERTGKLRATYSYTLTDLGVDVDANTPALATVATPSTTPTTSKLDYAEDVDVFTFQAEAGHVYQFTCDATVPGSPARFTCDVAFVDAQGSVVKRGSTTLTGTQAVASEFDAAATVYVRITTTGTFTDGTYKWLLTDLGLDDHGDTQARATAVTIPPTTPTDGRFELAEDVDMLSFQAQAGRIYEFTCAPTNVTCNATFLDAAGTSLRTSSSTASSSAILQHKFATAGTYYVRLLPVSPKNITTTYSWTLQDRGVDDHGDSLPAATAVTPSTTPNPSDMNFPGDEDWFSFQAQRAQTLTFSCDSGGRFNCNLFLMDSGGNPLTSDTASALNASITHRFAAAGTYYIRLLSLDGKVAPYTWQLTDQGLDDHSDTDTSGTPLVLGTATSGKLQVPVDVDWFTVTLSASTAHTANLAASSSVIFTVFGPDRASVLASGTGTKSFNSGVAGTYYVRVAYQTTQSAVTSYTITVAK